MPLYFFNVFDDREYIKDNHGVELADVEQAKAELSRLVKLLPDFLQRPGVRVAVHDEGGAMLDERWIAQPETGVKRRA